MRNNTEILYKTESYYGHSYLYSQFKISKFRVSHIIPKIYSEDDIVFFDKLSVNTDLNILKIIRDNKMDITVDIEIPYLSQYGTLDINKHKLYDYDGFNSFNKVKNNLQFIAMKIPYSNEYNYFSFESALIDFGNLNSKINIISDFGVSIKNTELNAKNVKILTDIENEEIKTIDNFEEILDLKMFIEEHQLNSQNPEVIFKLSNIYKVKSVIDQPFNSNLVNARIFEFFMNANIIEGFQIKGTLLEAIPDYISLGYDKEDAKMKIKGSPIGLNLNLTILTKKTLSIFWAIKNKNLHKISGTTPIDRDISLGTKPVRTLLKILKSIETLKEMSLLIKVNDKAVSYIFKNLTKSRREQIIDAIWGLNTLDSSGSATLVDLKLLQEITDNVTGLN